MGELRQNIDTSWGEGEESKGRVLKVKKKKKTPKEKKSRKGQSHFLKRYLTVGRLKQ